MTTFEIVWSLFFRGLSAVAAVVAVFCAVFVARRADAWRNSDAEKVREARLSELERSYAAHDRERASINERLAKVATKEELQAHRENMENRLNDAPSKADFASLKAQVTTEMTGLRRDLEKVDGGVERIERFLMERGQ